MSTPASCIRVFAALLMAVPAASQASMTVDPGPLTAGSSAEVTYSNPAKAGEEVEIEIDNGSRRNPEDVTIKIKLDENGNGSYKWVVPIEGWYVANFNAPDVHEVARVVSIPKAVGLTARREMRAVPPALVRRD